MGPELPFGPKKVKFKGPPLPIIYPLLMLLICNVRVGVITLLGTELKELETKDKSLTCCSREKLPQVLGNGVITKACRNQDNTVYAKVAKY
jgi:hypothetical protein